jgi:esterase/lipase superfamily enzyme
LHLTVNLSAAQVAALLAAPASRSNTDNSEGSRDVPWFGHPANSRALGGPRDLAPNPGEEVTDKDGKLRYHVMRVYYATDRKPLAKAAGDPENFFGGERGNNISYGAVNVTLPKNHAIGQLESPSMWLLEFKADPEKHVTLQGMQALNSDAWRAEIAKRATHLGNPGILVFVHGYKNSFADAALRAGQLAYDLKFGGTTVIFSWPSRNEVHGYMADEDAADWATGDMKTVLASLATLAPDTKIYVVAHSMGNRVFARGFQAMLSENPKLQTPFKEVVMAAPDIDADVFKRNIAPVILNKGTRFTLYASSKDEALMMSRELHGGYRRLGESGENILVMSGMDTVDASTVDTGLIGHSYYGDIGTVISDMKYVIRQSLPPETRADKTVLEPVNVASVGQYWRFRAMVASAAP